MRSKVKEAGDEAINRLRRYAMTMIERETRGNGDQINAIERVAKLCGVTPSALRRLAIGQTKAPDIRVYSSVRRAYVKYIDDQMASLQAEREVEAKITETEETVLTLGDEIDALRAKLRARKEQLAQERIGA